MKNSPLHLYDADGLPMNTSTGTTANAFKYTAKELSLFRGLPVYDYTARHTLPAGGNLFRTMVPLCESYADLSPYSFCGGDPINYKDHTGKWIDTVWGIGSLIWYIGAVICNLCTGDHQATVSSTVIREITAGIPKNGRAVNTTTDDTKASKVTTKITQKSSKASNTGDKDQKSSKNSDKVKLSISSASPNEVGKKEGGMTALMKNQIIDLMDKYPNFNVIYHGPL